MNMTEEQRKIYPITATLLDEVTKALKPTNADFWCLQPESEKILETLLEYEHGSADVESVFGPILKQHHISVYPQDMDFEEDKDKAHKICLQLYGAVCADLIAVLEIGMENEKENLPHQE